MNMGQTCCGNFLYFSWGYGWWLDEEGSGILVDGDLEDGFSVVCWNEKGGKDFLFLLLFLFYLKKKKKKKLDGSVGSDIKCYELMGRTHP